MEGSGGGFGFPFGGDPRGPIRRPRGVAGETAETRPGGPPREFAAPTPHNAAEAYRDVFVAIEHEQLDSNISVKPTALGLDLSYDLCLDNLESLLREAAKNGNFVRIDMEDSSTTSETLRLYRELRERGFDNVGVVLQAYLRDRKSTRLNS